MLRLARCPNGSSRMKMKFFNRTAPKDNPRPEDYPLGSLESRMAMRAALDSGERDIIEICVLGPYGGSAQFVVGKTGLTMISGSLPTPEQFETAYQLSQRERCGQEGMIDGAKSLARSEKTPQPQCDFEQPRESEQFPIGTTVSVSQKVDPLAAVHRKRY